MIRENELQVVRRVYAKQIVHAARASDPRLEKVLAELRREDFLSAAPWQLMRFRYVSTFGSPSDACEH
jgi:hypothetical protein